MIPVNYVVRNLARRRLRTTLTIIGIAMVVAVYFVMASVAETMVQSFRSTGAPDELVVVQAGAMTVDFSNIDRGSLTFLQTREDIAEIDGRPLVSPELALGSYATIGGRSRKVSIRGVTHEAPSVYQQAQLLEGSWPVSGFQGAIGITLASKYGIGIGDTVSFEGQEWTISGILASDGRVYDQEIWVDLDELAATSNRKTYSSYTIRAVAPTRVDALAEEINANRSFPLSAVQASSFYKRTGGMATFMASIGKFIAMIVAIGAVFGGMNTMYAAVAGRQREIAVLRAIGFKRGAILGSILAESVLLSLVAGVLGILLGTVVAMMPVELPYTGGGAVDLGPAQAISALILAAIIGVIGGGLPAIQAARTTVVEQLR